MAPYLIQWEAIKEARRRGCSFFDFLGIAPPGEEKGHELEGVSGFKHKFGGIVKSFPKGKEVIFNKFWYFLYCLRQL